jgi:hypothetical protein
MSMSLFPFVEGTKVEEEEKGSGGGVRKEEEGELGFGAERIKRGGRWEWWCVGGGPRSHA